jgi:hypothetical protein
MPQQIGYKGGAQRDFYPDLVPQRRRAPTRTAGGTLCYRIRAPTPTPSPARTLGENLDANAGWIQARYRSDGIGRDQSDRSRMRLVLVLARLRRRPARRRNDRARRLHAERRSGHGGCKYVGPYVLRAHSGGDRSCDRAALISASVSARFLTPQARTSLRHRPIVASGRACAGSRSGAPTSGRRTGSYRLPRA